MNKVKHSVCNITPFGGLNSIFTAFTQAGIFRFLDQEMGSRNWLAKYKRSDIVFSLFCNALCNGEYISDLEQLSRIHIGQLFNKIPSPDTVEYACKELVSKTRLITSESGIEHQINSDNKLNKLLISLCVKTNLLNKMQQGLVLDYDNMIIENNKYDALRTYKHTKGYQPGAAFIGRCAVHIENRNGNTPARYRQEELLTQCLDNLKEKELQVGYYRGDSASYQQSVVNLMNSRNIRFFIRNMTSTDFDIACGKVTQWEKIEINYQSIEVASIEFTPFDGKQSYRIVVTRTPKKDLQIGLFCKTFYNYQGIITNDRQMTNKDVIEFYNQRGDASENSNKYLLSDFNMKRLPFSDLDTNTVYMYLTAICNNLFEYLKTLLVSNQISQINLRCRVKRVFFLFVSVCSKMQTRGRQKVIHFFNSTPQIHKILRI